MKIAQDSFRFQSDKRQLGGLLMLMSFCLIIFPLANIVSAFGPDGANTTDAGTIPFWGMFGGLCVFITGTAGVLAGYMASVHDYSNKYLNIFLMIAVQTTWIGYMTDMTAVGQAAQLPADQNGFIPLAYQPEDADVKFVGAMGIMGILAYGFAFAGSMAFMAWCLQAYTTGMPETRSGDYFKGRINFYSGVLILAGLVQFLLGVWCQARFDMNALESGPVQVAFLLVTYPGISIYIGLLQMINGVWGILRSRGYFQTKNVFQMSLAIQWVNVLVLQDIAQIAYLPGGMAAPLAPSLAAFSLGLSLMPAFLDHKMTSLPAMLPKDYYGDVVPSVEIDVSATRQDEEIIAEDIIAEDIEV